jgi:hypothetical protein
LILEAQTAKSLAVDELRNGMVKEASSRLQGTAATLRREASLIPVTDERSAQSLEIIRAEADEIDVLAQTAENEDIQYSSKRMTESYSRKTRSRNVRNQEIDPNVNPEDFIN